MGALLTRWALAIVTDAVGAAAASGEVDRRGRSADRRGVPRRDRLGRSPVRLEASMTTRGDRGSVKLAVFVLLEEAVGLAVCFVLLLSCNERREEVKERRERREGETGRGVSLCRSDEDLDSSPRAWDARLHGQTLEAWT